MLRWKIDEVLAGSHRPGYEGQHGGQVAIADVDEWLGQVKEMGIRSIICLLHEDQLSHYSNLANGLLEYYRQNGFEVRHVPAYDRRQPPLTEAQLEDVWACFTELEKPVLVHCSAGMDRTGLATKFIQDKLAEDLSA